MTTGGNIVIPNAGNIGSASDTDALAISSGGVVNFTQQPTVSSAAVKVAGKETIWIPAAAMYPTTTNGCSDLTQVEIAATKPELKCLDFSGTATEFAQFTVAFPKSWNEGQVSAQFFWTTAGTDTDGVRWGISAVAMNDNESINAAFGTAEYVTDNLQSAANELYVSAETSAFTIAGTPAEGDLTFFQVERDHDHGDDGAAEDARLVGIKLFFTTNAANDA